MKINKFEDIEAWKESRLLVQDVFTYFKGNKDFIFQNQIRRASISIMSNIAEGFDRGSNKEFIQFLIIARASVSEVKSLTYTAIDIKYINEQKSQKMLQRCKTISNLINGFIRYLRSSERLK